MRYFIFLLLIPFFSTAQEEDVILFEKGADGKYTSRTFDKYGSEIIENEWLTKQDEKKLNNMGMVYKKPALFDEVEGLECFTEQHGVYFAFRCLSNQLVSRDGQIIIFMPLYGVFSEEDADDLRSLFPDSRFDIVDTQHTFQLKGRLEYLSKETAENWKNYVNYYPENEAKERFKADTVIRFHIPLREKDFYKEKFKYVDALYIQKKGYGYAQLYVFYTDKAKKNLNKYWRKVEGILRYKE